MSEAARGVSHAALLLQAWLSPSFPTGAFAYSHGLEFAHESGDVTDRDTLEDWIGALVSRGSVRGDLVLAAIAHRATAAIDETLLREVLELALALSPSAERRLETVQQGNAFFSAVSTSWPFVWSSRLREVWPGDVALPIAFGVAAAGHGIARGQALPALGLSAVSALVSAAIRLGVVGQTDGQKVIAALVQPVSEVAGEVTEATFDDLGSSTFRSDLMSLKHETQYTRLFRS